MLHSACVLAVPGGTWCDTCKSYKGQFPIYYVYDTRFHLYFSCYCKSFFFFSHTLLVLLQRNSRKWNIGTWLCTSPRTSYFATERNLWIYVSFEDRNLWNETALILNKKRRKMYHDFRRIVVPRIIIISFNILRLGKSCAKFWEKKHVMNKVLKMCFLRWRFLLL